MQKHNRISDKSAVLGAVTFILRKETGRAALGTAATIFRHFFIPQFGRKFGLIKTPVVNVDHPLDDTIPFNPHHVKLYLSFTHLWIRSIFFIYREFGKPALPAIRNYIREIGSLYSESSKVYYRCMSTTDRPRKVGGFYFKVIHVFDPHLLCVPSLHVEVVNLNYLKISGMIDRFAGGSGEYEAEKAYLWDQAVTITDSILFIKQHSVNCVAAGLFVLSSGGWDFPAVLARRVIDELFTGVENRLESGTEVKEYIRGLYDRFVAEGEERPFDEVLEAFLLSYGDQDAQSSGAAEKKSFKNRAS